MQTYITPQLAELLGILVADGNVYYSEKHRVYRVKIAGDKRYEMDYFTNHLIPLFSSEFGVTPRIYAYKNNNGLECYFYSKKITKQLLDMGMVGNKTIESPRIPQSISKDDTLMKPFLRGYFDGDGSVYRKYGNYLQIGFRSIDEKLLNLIFKLLRQLGYHPSITLKHKNVFIHRQREVIRFFEEVKPANQKHWLRLKALRETTRSV